MSDEVDPHWEVFAVAVHAMLCVLNAAALLFHWLKRQFGHATVHVVVLIYDVLALRRHGRRVFRAMK